MRQHPAVVEGPRTSSRRQRSLSGSLDLTKAPWRAGSDEPGCSILRSGGLPPSVSTLIHAPGPDCSLAHAAPRFGNHVTLQPWHTLQRPAVAPPAA